MDKKGSGFDKPTDFNCMIGSDTKITGDITGTEDILINGEINGDVDVKAKIYVGESGEIVGTIKAVDISIEGKVEGNLKIQDKIELAESAYITADIECGKLEVADGAFYEGKIHMEGVEKIK